MTIPWLGRADGEEIFSSLSRFKQFDNFCSREYRPIEESIQLDWCIFPGLYHHGYYAMTGVDPNTGRHVIWIRRPPANLTDAYLIAHEMMHVIREVEGLSFQFAERDHNYADVAGYLRSVLDDRVVDLLLINDYEFNVINHYIESMASSIEFLKEIDVQSITDIRRIELILINADNFLRWSLINNNDNFDQIFVDIRMLLRRTDKFIGTCSIRISVTQL